MNEKIEDLLGLGGENLADKSIDVSDVIEKEVEFDFNKHIEDNSPAVRAEEKPEVKETKKAKSVDLTKLTILDRNAIEKEKDLKSVLYGGKSAFQIVAAQSGYMAKVIPLVNKDVINLLYSNLSSYEYRKTIFKVIYDKVVGFSVGNLTFEEWLKNTSVGDIETFYYGIYCATFPNDGTFTFACPNCGEEQSFRISHNNLLKTTDKKKMKELINDVSKNSRSKEDMIKYSLINKTEGFELEDSGIIMELRTPSLWDLLEIFRTVPENVIDRDEDSVNCMLYIKRFLIPSKTDEGNGYTEQSDGQEVLRIIDNLSIDDATSLKNSLREREDANRLSYSIKNLTCSKCKKEVKDTPISIEDILFTLIFEKTNQ